MVSDAADFTADKDGFDSVVIGRMLAEELGLSVGRLRGAYQPGRAADSVWHGAEIAAFSCVGNFRFGILRLRRELGIRHTGGCAKPGRRRRRCKRASNFASRMWIVPERWAALLAKEAGSGYVAATWMDENRALFRALRLEKLVTALFIGLITFVAGLNILVVLAMTVSDRARDIAVLMAMGAQARPNPPDFRVARNSRGRRRDPDGTGGGIFSRVGRWHLSADSARPANLLGAVRAVSAERQRRFVDCGSRARDQRDCHARARARRVANTAGGAAALRITKLDGGPATSTELWMAACSFIYAAMHAEMKISDRFPEIEFRNSSNVHNRKASAEALDEWKVQNWNSGKLAAQKSNVSAVR